MFEQVHGGIRNSYFYLKDSDFLRVNYGAATMTTSTVISTTPNGVLPGMVSYISDDLEVAVFDGTSGIPNGIFGQGSADHSFENTPAVASGKVVVLMTGGIYELDYFETVAEDGVTDITYAAGDTLYASQNGLLTNDTTTSAYAIALVAKLPSSDDARLGIQLLI